MDPFEDRERAKRIRQEMWRISGLGIELIATVIAFMVIGYFLDRWLGTGPWLLGLGAAMGVLGGMIKAVREAKKAERRMARIERGEPAGRGGRDEGDR